MQSSDRGVRALLLDALGTIVWLRPPAPALRTELAARFGVEISEPQARRAMLAEIAYYRVHLDEGRDPDSLAALRRRCAEVLRAALPRSERLDRIDPPALTEAMLAALRFAPFPDAPAAIRAARARGERVVVVSNWDISLPDVLARVGLAPLLDGIVTSAGAGARKPDPAIFKPALEIAGTCARHATHVGDNLAEDVAGARAAGIAPILLHRVARPPPAGVRCAAVRCVASLAELP
jgi:putative hydrolase of the HAD superfamily